MSDPTGGLTIKPNIFDYHDFREFFEDWFSFLKKEDSKFSMRSLAQRSGFSVAYLPFVMKRKRKLSEKNLKKMIPFLKLQTSEQRYLLALRDLSEASSQDGREIAYKKIKKFKSYKSKNGNSLETYKYLNNWINVAIREMSSLKGFSPNKKWIQERLIDPPQGVDIERALKFLLEHKYLEVNNDGSVDLPKKTIECHGGIFKLSMSQFHTQMLGKAVKSIYETDSENRNLLGQTVAINTKDFDKVRDIMNEALQRIMKLAKECRHPNEVYHISHVAFPLTKQGS